MDSRRRRIGQAGEEAAEEIERINPLAAPEKPPRVFPGELPVGQ